jgi:hypothetical protein
MLKSNNTLIMKQKSKEFHLRFAIVFVVIGVAHIFSIFDFETETHWRVIAILLTVGFIFEGYRLFTLYRKRKEEE